MTYTDGGTPLTCILVLEFCLLTFQQSSRQHYNWRNQKVPIERCVCSTSGIQVEPGVQRHGHVSDPELLVLSVVTRQKLQNPEDSETIQNV